MKGERILKVSFQKSGVGSMNTRVSIPITWIRELGITEQDREIKVSINEDKITIEKA